MNLGKDDKQQKPINDITGLGAKPARKKINASLLVILFLLILSLGVNTFLGYKYLQDIETAPQSSPSPTPSSVSQVSTEYDENVKTRKIEAKLGFSLEIPITYQLDENSTTTLLLSSTEDPEQIVSFRRWLSTTLPAEKSCSKKIFPCVETEYKIFINNRVADSYHIREIYKVNKQIVYLKNPNIEIVASGSHISNSPAMGNILASIVFPVQTELEWKKFSDSSLPFTFEYPSVMETEKKFIKGEQISLGVIGPTQREGTEVFDGIFLSFYKKPLNGKTLDEVVDNIISKEDDSFEIIEGKHIYTFNRTNGLAYTSRGAVTQEYVYLPLNNNKSYLVAVISVDDPSDQGFQDIADRIVSTFELTN